MINQLLARLVEEVPAQSEAEHAAVERVVWSDEILAVAASGVDMAHHCEEARVLEVEVGIHVYNRIAARLDAVVACLHSVLTQRRTVIGCEIFGVEPSVCSEVAA